MLIGVLQIKLHIPAANSLKSKRFVIRSLLTRTRSKFNVSISEVGDHDLWQSAMIAIAVVSNENRIVNSVLSKVLDLVERERNVEVIDSQIEIL